MERFGADPARVHVIPHGAFDYLTRQEHEAAAARRSWPAVEGPVILWFGVLRPYKGVDVLMEAFREMEGAELWIVGRPWMAVEPLKEAARAAGGTVRFVDRFVTDPEIPAFFRRADVVVLPYRRIDQSGVLYTALAFGKAMVLSDVGGFSEVGRVHGAAELVPPEDPVALRDGARRGWWTTPAARAALGAARRGRRRGPLLLGRDRAPDAGAVRGAACEGDLHGQAQALGRGRARAPGRARARRWRPWWRPSRAAREHESQRLDLAAERHGLRLATDDELYAEIDGRVAGRRRPGALVPVLEAHPAAADRRWAGSACLNFHPAPLPDIRGLGGYNVAILEDFAEWGVSAHFVDEEFDTGDLVRVDRFPIDRESRDRAVARHPQPGAAAGAVPRRDRPGARPASRSRASPRARAAT